MSKISAIAAAAIKMAIQMEKDGRAFYEEAARTTKSELGRKIFLDLAQDEIKHMQTFQEMFDAMTGSPDWASLIRQYGSITRKVPIFEADPAKVGEADHNDIEAIRVAMDAERSSADYYGRLAEQTDDPLAKELFGKIRDEEIYHYDLLQLQRDSLTASGMWYDLSEFQMDGMY